MGSRPLKEVRWSSFSSDSIDERVSMPMAVDLRLINGIYRLLFGAGTTEAQVDNRGDGCDKETVPLS